MQRFLCKFYKKNNLPIESLLPQGKALFFDIETTGLSAANSMIYLIGTVNADENGCLVLNQWFADSLSSEKEIVGDFLSYASGFDNLVHFNGDTFDIPFIKSCIKQYHLNDTVSDMQSIDIYKEIRKIKHFLHTDRNNQKSIESLLGLDRQDIYSGGELIEVYDSYIRSLSQDDLDKLLLHNKEDVLNLYDITGLLALKQFLKSPSYRPISAEISDGHLIIKAEADVFLPAPLYSENEHIRLDIESGRIIVRAKISEDTVHLYHSNYTDYYYLPIEDTAIYKSVAQFTDRSVRKKATRETAYSKTDIKKVDIHSADFMNSYIKSVIDYFN